MPAVEPTRTRKICIEEMFEQLLYTLHPLLLHGCEDHKAFVELWRSTLTQKKTEPERARMNVLGVEENFLLGTKKMRNLEASSE